MSVCKSVDSGETWNTRRDLTAGTGACQDLAVAPSNSNIVYAVGNDGQDGRVFRSANAGNSWSQVTNNLAGLHSGNWCVYAVGVHPADANRVCVGTNRGVFASSNGGGSWNATGLTHSISALLYDNAGDVLYAATAADGVYRSQDDGGVWEEMNAGLDRLECLCLGLDPVNAYLFVGTDGGGVWRTPIMPPSHARTWPHYR